MLEIYAHFDGRTPGVTRVPPKRIDKWHGQFIEYGTYLVPSRRERQKARKRRLTFRMPEATVAAIKAFVDDEPRAYLNEIRAWLFENRYYSPCSKSRKWSISTIYTTLRKRIGYTLTALRRLAMQADALEMLRFKRAIADVPAECIVFVDESHVDRRDVRRRRGWSPRGFSTDVREWFGRGDVAYTLLAAVNVDGFLLNATTAVTGSNDSARFADWVEHRLCPELGQWGLGEPNSVVVLDNASIHHALYGRIARLIGARGARIVFLSPYSPHLNPIEETFHQVKCFIRKHYLAAAHNHHAVLRDALNHVSATNMLGFFAHAGYDVAHLVAAAPLPGGAEDADQVGIDALCAIVVDCDDDS